MTVLTITLIVLVSLVLLVWAGRHAMIAAHRRQAFALTEDYRPPEAVGDAELPFVSVIVAAKDEQENIGRCVSTLLEQDYPALELIVANDRSSDETAGIVGRLAEGDGRLRLINIGHLPEGWCGKNNAMQTAIAQAKAEWICMTDADCRQTSRRTLRAAVYYALQTGADLLSVLPNLEMKGFWENVVQPVCSGIMMIWFRPDKVNDPARPHAYANGAFMLMKRSAYEAVGTHEAVKDQVNEDMHMAAAVKGKGLKLRVVRNEGLYLVRMYTSLPNIVRGWSRIFYGTFGTLKRLSISLAVLVIMGMLPYACAVFGLAAAGAGAQPQRLLLLLGLWGAAAAAVQISVIYRFRRMLGAPSGLAWTYAIGCAVATVALAGAMAKRRRGAQLTWRNTTYTHAPGSE